MLHHELETIVPHQRFWEDVQLTLVIKKMTTVTEQLYRERLINHFTGSNLSILPLFVKVNTVRANQCLKADMFNVFFPLQSQRIVNFPKMRWIQVSCWFKILKPFDTEAGDKPTCPQAYLSYLPKRDLKNLKCRLMWRSCKAWFQFHNETTVCTHTATPAFTLLACSHRLAVRVQFQLHTNI